MTKTICDVCGTELDEDYTRYHFSYNLDFTGKKPHQSTNVNGMKMTTLLCYLDPDEYHYNLCQRCGSLFDKAIKKTIDVIKNSKE